MQTHCVGGYSFFDKTQSPYNLRRTIFTDEDGRYAMHSIMPNGYGCPLDVDLLKPY